jgi:SagB-type dehydrogenase family enzyme
MNDNWDGPFRSRTWVHAGTKRNGPRSTPSDFPPASDTSALVRQRGFAAILRVAVVAILALLVGQASVVAADLESRDLPPPQMTGGKPIMQALKERRTVRDFKPDPLSDQQMSDLLWAAFGVNRPAIDHRTAPSAFNAQDVDIYLAVADGLYLYDARLHRLRKVSREDVRGLTSGEAFAKVAPVSLVYVSDFARLAKAAPERREVYAGVDTGCIVQNVYLYCASTGLATVVHELERTGLAKAMNLRPDQHVVLAQAVGLPK